MIVGLKWKFIEDAPDRFWRGVPMSWFGVVFGPLTRAGRCTRTCCLLHVMSHPRQALYTILRRYVRSNLSLVANLRQIGDFCRLAVLVDP